MKDGVKALNLDQWGAVRAGKGLLISAHKQQAADGSHMDTEPAKSQLESGLQMSQALSDVAKTSKLIRLKSLKI